LLESKSTLFNQQKNELRHERKCKQYPTFTLSRLKVHKKYSKCHRQFRVEKELGWLAILCFYH